MSLPEVVDYLRSGGTLAELAAVRGIEVTESPTDGRVILNYSQCSSPKHDYLCRQCRGLVLDRDNNWAVVARPLPRFLNLGEYPPDDAKFDWSEALCQTKEDGSLILLYRHKGLLHVNTRASFGQGKVCAGLDMKWEELFWSAGIDEVEADQYVREGETFIFELCSPFNKVVRRYETPRLYLLTVVSNESGWEASTFSVDNYADVLRVRRPEASWVKAPDEVLRLIASQEDDPTFEGFVVRDRRGMRLKVKSPLYVALHHLKGEGNNLFTPKYLVPFIMGRPAEEAELLTYFPEVGDIYRRLKAETEQLHRDLIDLWENNKGLPTMKEFALAVKDEEVASFLFAARRMGVHPEVLWKQNAARFLIARFKPQPKEMPCSSAT